MQDNDLGTVNVDGRSTRIDTLGWTLQEVSMQLDAAREAARSEAEARWREQIAARDREGRELRARCAALQFALATILDIGGNAIHS